MYINSSERDITQLVNNLNQVSHQTSDYDGSYKELLNRAPNMAIINITDYNLSRMNFTILYNDTMQHSLPIVMNIFTNAYSR